MSGKSSKLAGFCALAVSAGGLLCGCAGMAPALDESTFFSDPAAYAMYDCKQLAAVRAAHTTRIQELQGLMTKAETAAGGSVIAEMAYRPDYVSAQAKLKQANGAWERSRCDSVTDPALARPPAGSEPAAGRSKGRVY